MVSLLAHALLSKCQDCSQLRGFELQLLRTDSVRAKTWQNRSQEQGPAPAPSLERLPSWPEVRALPNETALEEASAGNKARPKGAQLVVTQSRHGAQIPAGAEPQPRSPRCAGIPRLAG